VPGGRGEINNWFNVQGSALKGSTQPLAKKTAGLIESESVNNVNPIGVFCDIRSSNHAKYHRCPRGFDHKYFSA
jgi:hypothetical protein